MAEKQERFTNNNAFFGGVGYKSLKSSSAASEEVPLPSQDEIRRNYAEFAELAEMKKKGQESVSP